MLFIISCAVLLSLFESWRVPVGKLQMHAYLVLLGPLGVFLVATRITEFPAAILGSLLLFWSLYCFSMLAGGFSVSEFTKITASIATIVAVALMVRSRKDFMAGVIGLCLMLSALSLLSLVYVDFSRDDSFVEGANRNSLSLYSLPPLLFIGFFLTQKKEWLSPSLRLLFIAVALATCVVTAMSGNRSGWLGVGWIALMLAGTGRLRGLILILILAMAGYFWVVTFGETEVIENRIARTGEHSDQARANLIYHSFAISLDYPIAGVSPQGLPAELGRRLKTAPIMPHNVAGQIAGGSGVICFAAFILVGISLWRIKPRGENESESFRKSRRLLRMLVMLWIVRGMFTHEILYSPTFCIALGMAIGLCRTSDK